jgi:hypothetical protein
MGPITPEDDGFRPWDSIEQGDGKAEYERAINALHAAKMRAMLLSIRLNGAEAEMSRLRSTLHNIAWLDPYEDWPDGDAEISAQEYARRALGLPRESEVE